MNNFPFPIENSNEVPGIFHNGLKEAEITFFLLYFRNILIDTKYSVYFVAFQDGLSRSPDIPGRGIIGFQYFIKSSPISDHFTQERSVPITVHEPMDHLWGRESLQVLDVQNFHSARGGHDGPVMQGQFPPSNVCDFIGVVYDLFMKTGLCKFFGNGA